MTRAWTSGVVRGVLSAALCLVAAGCQSSGGQSPGPKPVDAAAGGVDVSQPQTSPDSGNPAPDTGSPATDTAPAPTDTGSAADTPSSAVDTGSPRPDVGGSVPPVDAGSADSGGKRPVAPSAGCTAAEQLPEGNGTLPGGRRYAVHLPAGYDKTKAYPLVFGNHPNGGNIGMFADQGTRTAFRDWAILVLTQSQTGDWRTAFPADLGYFDALVPLLKDKLCVDTNRIYSFGFSGGASFSNLLACKRDFLRAVGGGGGIPGYDGYTAADCKPMPAWIDEGDRAGLVELWTAKNGCTTQMPGVRANCRNYTCSIAPVVYCTNGAHTWPSYGSGDVAAFFKQF